MRFTEKLAVIFVRPLYRTFFERPLWWFLARVKTFFFAEVGVQLANIERRLAEDHHAQRLATIEERLRMLEANNAAQWDALEQLLLALFRQSEVPFTESVASSAAPDARQSNGLNRVHAASNLR